jgi:uncharacterized membrane protein
MISERLAAIREDEVVTALLQVSPMIPRPNSDAIKQRDVGALSTSRLEAFSDGVIAIIVTILVLDVKLPPLKGANMDAAFAAALWKSAPLLGGYVVSFVVVLVFWVAHHQLFRAIHRVDRNLLWLNGLFLMVLAFVPAPTGWIGQYPGVRLASVVYGSVLTLCGLTFFLLRLYATHYAKLMHQSIPKSVARKALARSLLSPILYGLGTVAARISLPLAWALFVAVPIIFIAPGVFERHVHRLQEE